MKKDNAPLRQGDVGEVPDRSNRVLQKGEHWYFCTREGVQIGPFSSHELALRGTNDYVGFAIDADPKISDGLSE